MSKSPNNKRDSIETRYAAECFRPLGSAVPIEAQGTRLDAWLATNYKFLSRAIWQKRITEGMVLMNENKVRPSHKLHAGDEIAMYYPPDAEPEVDDNISVIWQEDGVMAVFKPGNLPMHQNGPYQKNTFARFLTERIGSEWAAVHRLDLETSGIVLCGNTQKIRDELSQGLARHDTRKEYIAIVKGSPENKWTVDAPIGDLKDSLIRIKKWVVPDGQSATTYFECLERTDSLSLIKAKPITGRTNQIRIHSAYSGFRLLGDKLFHENENVFIEYFEKGNTEWVIKQTGFPRCCLHAAKIEFTHPVSNNRVVIESEIPDDMKAAWENNKARHSERS